MKILKNAYLWAIVVGFFAPIIYLGDEGSGGFAMLGAAIGYFIVRSYKKNNELNADGIRRGDLSECIWCDREFKIKKSIFGNEVKFCSKRCKSEYERDSKRR